MVRMMFLSWVIAISVASCATSDLETETALCKGLRQFASSTKANALKRVKLVTDWGNWKKTCSYYDDPDGQKFCQILMLNTSSEFMKLNVQSLIRCSGASLETNKLYVSELVGDISIFEINGLNPNIEVNIKFSIGSEQTDDFVEIRSIIDEF